MKQILALAYTYYSSDPRVLRESEALAQHGDQIEVLCLRKAGEPQVEVMKGVKIRHLPIQRYRGDSTAFYILGYFWFLILSFVFVSILSVRKRYDVIHVHNMPDFLVFAALIPKILGAKIILDLHDLMPETFSAKFGQEGTLTGILFFVERASINFAHHIITVHDPYVKLLESRGVPPDKITPILNLPDHKIFYPRDFRQDSNFTLIYFGTVAERHGIDLLLRALACLKSENLPIRFLLIGEGDAIPDIKRMVAELNLEEMVELKEEFVPVREIPDYIRRAHMGIIPYRTGPATKYMLPVKMLEFISMELPVVSARLETIAAYFDDQMIMFFPPEDIDALTDAIRKMFYSETLRKSLVENAKRFSNQFHWANESDKLVSVYEELTTPKAIYVSRI